MTSLTDPPLYAGIVCDALSDDDRSRLHEAAEALLDARGILVQMTGLVASRLDRLAMGGLAAVGDAFQVRVLRLVERMLWRGYRLATLGLDRRASRSPRLRRKKLFVSASGAIAGLIGLPGLAFDLPLTMATMLRSIAEIARAHGEDLGDPATRRACIEVFTLGGLPRADADLEISYWTARAALNHATIGTTIQQAARLLSVTLSQKLLTQAVPIAGAAAGGAVNYLFLDYLQRIARVHFVVRQLERRTGDPATVRAAVHEIITRLRRERNPGWDDRAPATVAS